MSFIVACATAIGIHVGSYHFDTDYNYNNSNPGVYFQHRSGFVAGTYYNSYRQQSTYAGYTLCLDYNISVTAVRVTGYEHMKWSVIPSLKLGPVRLMGSPPVGNISGFIHLAVEYEF